MKKTQLILSFLTLLFIVNFGSVKVLNAQALQAKSYSLSECIQLAIDNSFQLQTDSLLCEALQMQINREQTNYYPQISGAIGVSGLFLSPYSFGQHYLQAIADWDLGKFWYKTSEIQQKQYERQEAVQQQNKLEIVGVIAGLYIDVQQYNVELEILKTRLAYLNQHLNILSALWKAGTTNQLDILQTKSTINDVKEALLNKQVEADQLKYAMAMLMGADVDSDLSLNKFVDFESRLEDNFDNQEAFIQEHPKLRVIQKEYEIEQLKKREVSASLMPHIQAYSGYTFDGDPTGDGGYALLGLGASIPIYQFNKNKYQLKEIDITSEAIQSKKQNAERELSIKYGQILKQIQQFKKILDFQEEKIVNDEKQAQVAEINYKAGLSGNLDFLLAQQTLIKTTMQMNAARNRYLKSVIALYLITGQTEKIKNIK
jgi:outer membrane protein TolC